MVCRAAPTYMTQDDIKRILANVEFPGWWFTVGGTDRHYIQGHFLAKCRTSGDQIEQFTRKWYISEHACKNEVVNTALKCVLTGIEHEAREQFKYRGSTIYAPHFDVDFLADIAGKIEALDFRLDNRIVINLV